MSQAQSRALSDGMDAVQLAYLDVALARATMRAHMDIEARVAHWLLEGRARPQELAEARKRLRDAKHSHARAKAAYAALATQRYAGVNGRGWAVATRAKQPKSPKIPKPKKPRVVHVGRSKKLPVGRFHEGARTPRGALVGRQGAEHLLHATGGSPALDLMAGAGLSSGLSGVILDLVGEGRLPLVHALDAFQREQDRVANRAWRRPGGMVRLGGL